MPHGSNLLFGDKDNEKTGILLYLTDTCVYRDRHKCLSAQTLVFAKTDTSVY